jgi:serine/threonine protein kinase
VIDFGVAKATGQALTQRTLNTGFGAVVGTPQYMSLAQATLNNLDIDTRSDVYSLDASAPTSASNLHLLLKQVIHGEAGGGRHQAHSRGSASPSPTSDHVASGPA